MKKILISTGGSGGHVFPAIAFFEHLTHKFDIQLVTDIRGSRFLDKNKTNYKMLSMNFNKPNKCQMKLNNQFKIYHQSYHK